MKKIFYLILLSILLVVPGKVEALSLTPTSAWSKALYSDGYYNVTPVWNGTYYVANLPYSGNGLYISDIGFVYNNVTLCDGGNFSIQGNIYVYADDPVYKNSHVYFNYGSGDLACQTSYYSNYTGLSFTCTGKGLYNKTTQFMVFDINYEPDYIHQTRFLNYGIVKDFNVSCELSDEDVIANQNANTNSIINNQNLNKNEIINNQTQNQQQTNERLDELNQNMTSEDSDVTSSKCGMICKLKGIFTGIIELPGKIANLIIDGLKSLFVPDDMSFVTNFVDALESKLGFIASIPVQIIEFAINLVTASWDTFDSISFPSIEVFGYKFWDSQEIDLTEAINIFKPFKYVTDVICVVICARTLNKWRETFTGGN